jgi:diguanylate cyclase (GGDEF)-like protein
MLNRSGSGSRADEARSARLAGGVGGSLFLAGAAITALVVLLPHPSTLDEMGYWYLCMAQLFLGGLLFGWSRVSESSQRWLAPLTVAAAILAVTVAIYLNGEHEGGPALLNEFFYVWPALYAGYFYKRAVVVVVVVAIGLSYVAVDLLIGIPATTVVVRSVITISVVGGTAAVAHTLRTYVDALVGRLHRLARTDSLTGLFNRRYFDERLAIEILRTERVPQPLSLLVGDVDRFKTLNDRFGHAAGDKVLAEIGLGLLSSVRKVDTLARIGGEEFALLMPATSEAEAMAMAERLRASIGNVTDPTGQPVQITFGVASTEHTACNGPDSLLLAADRALYSGKARGRNRTLAYADSMEAAIAST